MIAALSFFAQSDGWDPDGWNHMNGWGGGWMWLWGVTMMIIFVVLLVWLTRSSVGPGGPGTTSSDPAARGREILAERYAKGELSTEEYRERASELQ